MALALSLVGVEREAVVADYVRTAENMPAVLARTARTVASLTAGAQLAVQIPPAFHAAPASAMDGFLDALGRHGGAAAWYLAAGGDRATLARLGARLVG